MAWDPLGDPPAEAAAPFVLPGAGAEALWEVENASFKVSEKDHTRLLTDMQRQCQKQGLPWSTMPDPRPDLSWHKPTCSFETWKHSAVKVKLGAGMVDITLNRPDDSNAFNDEMVAALCDAIFILHSRPDLRVAVFSGEGKMFSSGRDPRGDAYGFRIKATPEVLKAVEAEAAASGAFPDGKVDADRLLQSKFWHTLATLPQFTIGLANGSALGEGMGFLCCCDMAIALKTSFFGFDDTQFGIVNAVVSPYVLHKMGAGETKKMFLWGKIFPAEAAQEKKIVNKVVDTLADGRKAVEELCAELTKCAPHSVDLAKQLVMGCAGNQISELIIFYTMRAAANAKASQEAQQAAKKTKPWEQRPIAPAH